MYKVMSIDWLISLVLVRNTDTSAGFSTIQISSKLLGFGEWKASGINLHKACCHLDGFQQYKISPVLRHALPIIKKPSLADLGWARGPLGVSAYFVRYRLSGQSSLINGVNKHQKSFIFWLNIQTLLSESEKGMQSKFSNDAWMRALMLRTQTFVGPIRSVYC